MALDLKNITKKNQSITHEIGEKKVLSELKKENQLFVQSDIARIALERAKKIVEKNNQEFSLVKN